jgi:hypothetical protein
MLVDHQSLIPVLLWHVVQRSLSKMCQGMELLFKVKLNLANHWLEAAMARKPQASPQLACCQNALTGAHELYRAHKRTSRLKIWI